MNSKRTTFIYSSILLFILTGCTQEKSVFAPDKIFPSAKDGCLFISNRSTNELHLYNPTVQVIEKKVTFETPVNDIELTEDQHLWVVCNGPNGLLHELNPEFEILSSTRLEASPSAVLYNPVSHSLWVTQRFNNSLCEINPQTKEVISKIEVGREPVDMVSFNQDKHLLIVNNMPEMSSLSFPVAVLLTVVDVNSKLITKRIQLPNGSTDVKAVALSPDQQYAYVTHLLARYQLPTNQVDRGWMSTNALSIIDLEKQERLTTVLLDTPQKGTANPWEVTVTEDNKQIVIAASGTHELVCIDRKAMHERINQVKDGEKITPSTTCWEDIPNDAGFLYGISSFISTEGKGPRTVVTIQGKVFTANYFTGELIEINLHSGEKLITRQNRPSLISTQEGKGNMYFHDASLCFQGWQSCASCHPNDGRVDGLNWDQKNDGLGNPKNTKSLLLAYKTPPCMITGIRKDAKTAVRSGFKHIFFATENEEVTSAMDVWLKSLKPATSPFLINGKLSETALRGKIQFDTHCLSCHSGPYYTNQQQYQVDWAVGPDVHAKMDVPSLIEIWRTSPYLYDGRVYSIREMLDIHGPVEKISEKELNDLAEYVLSL